MTDNKTSYTGAKEVSDDTRDHIADSKRPQHTHPLLHIFCKMKVTEQKYDTHSK